MTVTTTYTEPERWINRIELIAAGILQVAIAVISVGAMYRQMWLVGFSGVVVLLLTFTPAIIEHRLKVTLPVEFTLLTCMFLFASFVLGEVSNFYERIWWWDLALHGLSAVLSGFIGFLAVYVFHMTNRIQVNASHVAAFTFGFAVTFGTLWEIFEFVMDWYFSMNMQKSGLIDSMTDLIINAFGALVAATVGFFYVRNGDSLLGHRLFKRIATQRPGEDNEA